LWVFGKAGLFYSTPSGWGKCVSIGVDAVRMTPVFDLDRKMLLRLKFLLFCYAQALS
jgi:hypothetical protein